MGRGVGAGVMTDSIGLFAIYMLYRRASDFCTGRKDNASKKQGKKLSFCF